MLKVFNTLTGKKEVFEPIEAGKVKMYVCGITVYDYCHIGHARAMISFDVISRFLRHTGYDLTFVRNITDVDDKIIKRADENGESPAQLTERMIAAMHEDETTLGNKLPDLEPKATEFMQQIIDMIQVLVDKGFAYQGESGDVYYRASKFEEYGKLNNRKERVFAQHRALCLIIQFQVDPVHGEVPAPLLGAADEVPTQLRSGGLGRNVLRFEDLRIVGDPGGKPTTFK